MIEKIFFPIDIDLMHYQCQNFLILSHFSECFDVPAGCQGTNLLFGKMLAEKCMKMKEIGPTIGRSQRSAPLPRSANTKAIRIPHRAHILTVNCCSQVHNAQGHDVVVIISMLDKLLTICF